MALETLNNRYDIRHFDEGGSTSDPIAGLYGSVLGREADAPGLEYWTNAYNTGTSLADIESAFRGSQEFQSMGGGGGGANTGGGGSSVTVESAGSEYDNAQPINQTGTGPFYTTLPGTVGGSVSQVFNQQAAAQPAPLPVTAGLEDWYRNKETGLGREADIGGLTAWSKAFGETLDPNEIAILESSDEFKNRQFLTGLYDKETGREYDQPGYDFWMNSLGSGTSKADIEKAFNESPEGSLYDIYDQNVGRAPDLEGSKYYTDQLAAGRSRADIEREIALSQESINFNKPNVISLLEATLGKDIVSQLTPEQITEYTKLVVDPGRVNTNRQLATKSEFDYNFYLTQNPDVAAAGVDPYSHYLQHGYNEGRAANNKVNFTTQDDNLRDVYRQIALDPILGPKLKAENPEFWEQVTPLERNPQDVKRTERIAYGDYGFVNVNGVDVPKLNARVLDNLFGADGFGTISDFSHGRGNLTNELGWSSNSFSNKAARGAEAIGVTTIPQTDEFGNTTYTYQGLDEAARVLGLDTSKFQDKQIQATTKDQYDSEGQLVQRAGEPAFQTDEYGVRTPVMQTISRDQQLYDAINQSAKDIYLYTGDSLTPGNAKEGGAQSFDTVLYKRSGDKLIPITAPVAHGGQQNMDVYRPKDYGFAYYAQGPAFVAASALSMAMADPSFSLAAAVGSAMLPAAASTAIGATATGVVGATILGSAVGALSSTAAGMDPGKGALTGAVTGLVASGMKPLLSSKPMLAATDSIAKASQGVFSQAQVGNIIGATIASTFASAASGANGDQILNSFKTSLISSGLSEKAAQLAVAGVKEAFGDDPKTLARTAAATRLVTRTASTAALSGKNPEQIQAAVIATLVQNAASIAGAGSTPPKIQPTNPFGTENVGMTSGSVDNVLQSQMMDGIANNSEDPIAFMNAAKNWTGNGSENVAFVTTEMVKQGMPADQISADLQQLYRISADKADEYAQYMVSKSGIKTTPVAKATTTAMQEPTNIVAQTSVAAPQPQIYDTLVEMFKNPEASGPAIATLAQALPASRYDVGYSSSGLTSGATQGNLGGSPSANDPTSYRTYSPRPSGDEYSNVYPSVTGRSAQDPNYIRELVEAYKADPTYAPIREELQKLDPGNAVFANPQNAEVARTQAATTNTASPLYSGKQVTITGYPDLSAVPKPVAPPTPMAPEPRPEPMPAVPSPNQPANDPFILPEPRIPGRPITPIMPVSPPGAIPKIAPGSLPLTNPSIIPTPQIQPISPTSPQTPATPTTPVTPTKPSPEPFQEPNKNPQIAPTPAQQAAIQQVAKTPQDAKRLEIAVPRVTQLVIQGVPKTVAIPRVVTETGAPIKELTTIIEVTVPTPAVVPAPTPVPAPAPTTPAPRTPTPATGNFGIISPFLLQQYGGIKDLAPGLTAGGKYSLSGIPSTNLDMDQMNPNFPLQQFAATSPVSPLDLGNSQQEPDEPIQMATGGSTTQKAYNPYDISSGISGSLTPGLTKARLDYLLTGLPQSKAEGGSIEGHNPQFFSEGGLGSMENTFVEGDGDGTSDQVPAMLANGEFVIPADVVSGLGNGSNDAGAEVLHEFLKAIREHKHSGKADKLPPESKGPLAYLTNAKRKVKVA